MFGFGQKMSLESFQFWLVMIFDSTFVLTKYSGSFKNLYLYQKIKKSKGKLSGNCEDKIMKHLKVLVDVIFLISDALLDS